MKDRIKEIKYEMYLIKREMLDLKKLEYHAEVSNKVPIFLVQFLKQDKTTF